MGEFQSQDYAPFSTKSFIAWGIGCVVLVAFIFIIDEFVGWSEVIAVWKDISILHLVSAFLLFALSHWLRAYRLSEFTFDELKGQSRVTLKLCLIHQFFNNLLPMRLGEIFFPLLLKRYFGIRWLSGTGSLFWLRLMDGVLVLGLFFIVLLCSIDFLKLWMLYQSQIMMVLGGVAVIALILLAFSLLFRQRALKPPQIIAKVFQVIKETAPKNKRHLFSLLFVTLLIWAVKLFALVFFLLGFDQMNWVTSLSGVLGAELSSILPFHGIAGTGSYELGFMLGVVPGSGFQAEDLSFAVNLHAFVFVSTSLLALCACLIRVPLFDSSNRRLAT